MQKRYLQSIAQTGQGEKKKRWELTKEFEQDLRILTNHLTDYVREYAKRQESPEEVVVTKDMFRSMEFQNWSRDYYQEYYRYDKIDNRNEVDIFVVLAQFLFSVLEDSHYTAFDDFGVFETLGDSMFDFCVNELRGQPFTFNEAHHYTLSHTIHLEDNQTISFVLQIVSEDVEEKENTIQSSIAEILTVTQENHIQEKVQHVLALIDEFGGYSEERQCLTQLHCVLENLK